MTPAKRFPCPVCHAATGFACTRPTRTGGGRVPLVGFHSSRTALTVMCPEHRSPEGVPCRAQLAACDRRVQEVSPLVGAGFRAMVDTMPDFFETDENPADVLAAFHGGARTTTGEPPMSYDPGPQIDQEPTDPPVRVDAPEPTDARGSDGPQLRED